jgi:hypothetical protein
MYTIILYELIIFKKELANKKTINKKYFKQLYKIKNVDIKNLNDKIIKLKMMYKDNKYIIDFIKDDNINYIELLNKKSYKDYIKYINKE